jgi:ParB-like chromosome segregation protein Spo0J
MDISDIINCIEDLPIDKKIETINEIKLKLHEISPFKSEPVDCVLWVPAESVAANDYNPNKVAPPEMKLLEHSIEQDGYTQPIVSWPDGDNHEVVDGFHRNRVGKESESVKKRTHGYLPIVSINAERIDKNNRIAATIRHNRARGKHQVTAMSDIVMELKNRNWTNNRIAKELGMDADEILRLCQITGLSQLFSDQEFSKAWDIEDSETDFEPITEEFDLGEDDNFRTVNTNDDKRIFHTYDKWECYKAGFYNTTMDGMTKDQCETEYANFLSDDERFSSALKNILIEWKNSCEHYLTNASMNRIAWLGQAAACYATGIPSTFRGGFNLLTEEQQEKANRIALKYLNMWLKDHGMVELTLEQALSTKQMDLY